MQDVQRVEVYVWQSSDDGYLHKTRTKTVREVYEEVRAIIGEYPDGGEEYFQVTTSFEAARFAPDPEWPAGDIVCFSVNGSSEGDYTHVEVHNGPTRKLLMLGKTFAGRDSSWGFARRLADLLEVQ